MTTELPNKNDYQTARLPDCRLKGLAVLLAFFFLSAASASALSSSELINNANQYNNQTVEYIGEVIGDIMVRNNYAWLNVSDGENAIGVWTPKELVKDIKMAGNYRQIGDKIKITGTFYQADPKQGGDLDINATEITVLENGYTRKLTINYQKLIISAILLAGTLAIIFIPKLEKS